MPTISAGLLTQISTGIQGRFAAGLGTAAPAWRRIAMEVQSTKKGEIYPFIGDFPTIEKWIGTRQAKQLSVINWQIDNEHFEGTLKINRDQVEDNDVAGFYPYAERLGRAAAMFPDKLLATLVEAGWTTACYDGQYFFDTDHGAAANVSNKGTSALSASTYATGRAAMAALKSDSGEPLGIIPDLLMVPPALEGTARSILNSDFVADQAGGAGVTNVWKGSAELMVNPWLTDTNDWYLFATNQLLPALIVQIRKNPEMVARVSLTDDNVFWMNEFVWGVDMRLNAGFGAWQCAYGAHV